jgi:cephalosporin hydroxylase
LSEARIRTQMKYWAMLRTLAPAAIDLSRAELVRSAAEAQLATAGGVSELVAALGLNDEGVAEFPEHLHPYFGGLRIWQYPSQFGAYLHHVGGLHVRSYLEVGVRHGGSFVATVEYLRKVGALELAIGVDIIRAPALDAYAAQVAGVETAWIDSRSDRFDALLADRGPFDLVFVDSHHEEEQCRHEVQRLATSARMIALHDVANVGCPGVGRVWAELTQSPDWHCVEFTEQYDRRGPFMGIGLAVAQAHAEPAGRPDPCPRTDVAYVDNH